MHNMNSLAHRIIALVLINTHDYWTILLHTNLNCIRLYGYCQHTGHTHQMRGYLNKTTVLHFVKNYQPLNCGGLLIFSWLLKLTNLPPHSSSLWDGLCKQYNGSIFLSWVLLLPQNGAVRRDITQLKLRKNPSLAEFPGFVTIDVTGSINSDIWST